MSFTAMNPPACSHVLSQANGSMSMEAITIVSGQGVLQAGTVVGRITAAGANLGKYAIYNNAATDGTGTASGVIRERVDATSADVAVAANVRLTELVEGRLRWAAGTSAADKTAAYADLAAALVIVRLGE